jgi:hypothetical protein
VVEILGEELAEKVSFETPREGRKVIDYYLNSPNRGEERERLFRQEKKAIASYTYTHLAFSIIDAVKALG